MVSRMLDKGQKADEAKIKMVMELTQCKYDRAEMVLRDHRDDVEAAIDYIFEHNDSEGESEWTTTGNNKNKNKNKNDDKNNNKSGSKNKDNHAKNDKKDNNNDFNADKKGPYRK